MANRRIKMMTYELIISRLQKGEFIRSIERAKLAGKKTIMRIKKIALERGWLNQNASLPCERELLAVFQKKVKSGTQLNQSGHLEKITQWAQEGYQASTIYSRVADPGLLPGQPSKVGSRKGAVAD